MNRKLRMGLIGGGQGSFIGRVHATAAVLDNRAALVAGALSSSAEKSKASASSSYWASCFRSFRRQSRTIPSGPAEARSSWLGEKRSALTRVKPKPRTRR